MSSINLLPWRERTAQQQKQRFLFILATLAIVTLAIVWGVSQWFDSNHQRQLERNALLQQHISQLDLAIANIQDIGEKREALIQRMTLIETLQQSRNASALIFTNLAVMTPDGLALQAVRRVDNTLLIDGHSASNNRLSGFIRALDDTPYFVAPELSSVTATPDSGRAVSDFRLTLSLSPALSPTSPATAQGEAP
jgi:type IV pilus assembly protein PilN